MTMTTPETSTAPAKADPAFTAHLGTAPDGSPVTVHARGHILMQGRIASGKSHTFNHLAAQWRALPGVNVAEVRYLPRDQVTVNGHWGWTIVHNGHGAPVTYGRVMEFFSELATRMRRPVPEQPEPPALLLLEEVRLTTRTVVEAIETILLYGRAHGLHALVCTPSMDYLVASLRRHCATTIFLDPAADHTTAAADARQRAAALGYDLPTGPGSFIVANDRCDIGRVPATAPGEETR